MIGQCNLQSRIEQLIENHTFPRFSIFVGPKGSGKKTFVDTVIIGKLALLSMTSGIKVDEVRQLIVDSYKMDSPVVCFIPDADTMSNAAKNALLKVTEEPPNNAYFIMTLEDENNTLETIRSRGTVFHMDRYTPDEIETYASMRVAETGNKKDDEHGWNIIRELCETPGDVNTIVEMGVLPFYDYVQLVVDNVAEVSLANAFKIPSKVALKEDAEGYDFILFLKCMIVVCSDRARQDVVYAEVVRCISKYLQKTRIKGVNRTMLLDNLILDVRELLK
jgi:hypothetical protein